MNKIKEWSRENFQNFSMNLEIEWECWNQKAQCIVVIWKLWVVT